MQVDTWKYRSGKSGYGCNWHIRDFNTGKTLMRATRLVFNYMQRVQFRCVLALCFTFIDIGILVVLCAVYM